MIDPGRVRDGRMAITAIFAGWIRGSSSRCGSSRPGSERYRRSRRLATAGQHLVLIGCTVIALASAAQAQTVVLGPEGVARSEGLGRAFQTFSIFGGTPGVAAAKFYSDFDLNNFQLPITHTFEPFDGGYLNGIAPYAELTVDYLTGDQTFPLTPNPNSPSNVKLSFDAWSVLAGGGFDVPLGGGFRLRPIVLAGYSHVGGDANFFGPNSALFRSLVGGVLSNASLNSALLGGALELIYETRFPGDVTLKTQARYNELAALVTGASSNALQQNSSFGVANASISFSGPTNWRIAANDIRWLGYVKGTWLPNTDPGVLGFNAFAEIGGGLQLLAPNVIRGVQGGTVRASAIVGPGVTGWLFSAALDF